MNPVNTSSPTQSDTRSISPASSLPASAGLTSISEAEQERLHQLALELRCLVCQNQSIADSNSGLAVDLRNQIAQQIKAGQSDVEIKQYMAERYGDFVLYKPPFSMENAVLWLGPFLLLAIGVVIAWRSVSKRKRQLPRESEIQELASPSQNKHKQEIEARYQQDVGT